MKDNKTRTNTEITANQIRVINSDGNQEGIMNLNDALALARKQNLDLVEVAPLAKPPVCKILDWGKENYRQQKSSKAAKAKQHVVQLKELQFRPVTDPHDIGIKLNKAAKFLEKGHKVKFSMRFRGREMSHTEVGMQIMQDILETLTDINIEKEPKLVGNQIQMIVSAKT